MHNVHVPWMGIESMTTRSAAKRPTLSRHTSRQVSTKRLKNVFQCRNGLTIIMILQQQ